MSSEPMRSSASSKARKRKSDIGDRIHAGQYALDHLVHFLYRRE